MTKLYVRCTDPGCQHRWPVDAKKEKTTCPKCGVEMTVQGTMKHDRRDDHMYYHDRPLR